MSRLVKQYRETDQVSGKLLSNILDKLDKLEIAEEEGRLLISSNKKNENIFLDLGRVDEPPVWKQMSVEEYNRIQECTKEIQESITSLCSGFEFRSIAEERAKSKKGDL